MGGNCATVTGVVKRARSSAMVENMSVMVGLHKQNWAC